jgi:hypothetical protein
LKSDLVTVLPNWITAITAVGALVGAVIAARATGQQLRATHQQLRIEQKRDADRDEEASRWQANLVGAWIDTDIIIYPKAFKAFRRLRRGVRRLKGEYDVVAAVRNASTVPIYDLKVTIATGNGETSEEIPGNICPPNATVHLPWEGRRFSSWEEFRGGGVTVEFTDASGRRWHRDRRGRLAEVSP